MKKNSNKGKHQYWVGKKRVFSKKWKENIGKVAKIRQKKLWQNPEYRKKMSDVHKWLIGEKNPNWRGGITSKILKRCNQLWWKELRKKVYERDNWLCQICGKHCHKDIQCHHVFPERLGGQHTLDNLITLCRKCHMLVDNIQKLRKIYED